MLFSTILNSALLAIGVASFEVKHHSNESKRCQELQISVTASAQNFVFPELGNLSQPGAVQALGAQVPTIISNGERVTRGGTFEINGRYCLPTLRASRRHESTVQLLVHGLSYTKEYWSSGAWSAPDATRYSWTRFANEQGYATLQIDRLGNGKSSRPDPSQIVQLPLQTEIIYQIAQQLKDGKIGNKTYRDVVGVGHSWGSCAVNKVARDHPTIFSAVVLTGYLKDFSVVNSNAAALGFQPAKDHQARFGNLSQGYMAGTSEQGRSSSFYTGQYDPAIPPLDYNSQGTGSTGELIVYEQPAPAYRGHVFISTGDHDIVFCGNVTPGNCQPASNSTVARTVTEFPNAASFDYVLAESCGHDVNFHLSAPKTYAAVHRWLGKYF